MPKAKPVSLFPLTFDEAMNALIRVNPEKVGLGGEKGKGKPKAKKR